MSDVEKDVTSGFCDKEDKEKEPGTDVGFLLQHLPVQRLLWQDRNMAFVIDGATAAGELG